MHQLLALLIHQSSSSSLVRSQLTCRQLTCKQFNLQAINPQAIQPAIILTCKYSSHKSSSRRLSGHRQSSHIASHDSDPTPKIRTQLCASVIPLLLLSRLLVLRTSTHQGWQAPTPSEPSPSEPSPSALTPPPSDAVRDNAGWLTWGPPCRASSSKRFSCGCRTTPR
jgi:hypothetical protein